MPPRHMVRSLFLLGLLATSAASAQTIALKYSFQDGTSYKFNASSCGAEIQVTWTSTITLGLCPNTELKLWATELECTDTPGAMDVKFTSVPFAQLATGTGTFGVKLAALPGFKYSDAGFDCGTELIERPHKICGSITLSSTTVIGGACTVKQAGSLILTYDTKPPGVPTITEINEQDGALQVKFTADSDTSVVHFDTRAQGTTDFVQKEEIATSAGSSIRLTGLTNGTTYDIQARAEDDAKNFSSPSDLIAATPRLTKGFWARYRDAGGTEQGGCQSVQGIPWLLAGGLWLLRRKRN